MNDCFMISDQLVGGGGNHLSQPRRQGRPVNTVIVVYIAVQSNPLFVHYATQFVKTYREFEGGPKHALCVVCNGGHLAPKMKAIFDGIECHFLVRPQDEGWDISAYQEASRTFCVDLMVCFGESVRFHRAGWLNRLVDSASEYGEGMYGCLSSHAIRAHLNTTAFAVTPRFLKQYPAVRNKAERYNFEHGETAMWRGIVAGGGEARLVTWDGCWGPGEWRKPDGILWRGDQSNCLVWTNHHDKYHGGTPQTRHNWSAIADMPFK
jgi:hypothetical protein